MHTKIGDFGDMEKGGVFGGSAEEGKNGGTGWSKETIVACKNFWEQVVAWWSGTNLISRQTNF